MPGKITALNNTGRVPIPFGITIPANGSAATLWDLIKAQTDTPPFRKESCFGWQIRGVNADGSDRNAFLYGNSETITPIYVPLGVEETSPTYQLNQIFVQAPDASSVGAVLVVFV